MTEEREPPVRTAVLGAGDVAQVTHLPAYVPGPGCRVTVLCDVDEARARRVAERFNVSVVVSSFQEGVRRDDVGAVDVCLPNHPHASATVAALEAGKHVLCGKPFSRRQEEAAPAHPRPEGEAQDDTASALLPLERGVAPALQVSWSLLLDCGFVYRNPFGRPGAALLQPWRLHLETEGRLVDVTPPRERPGNGNKRSCETETGHFRHCVREGRQPDSPADDALRVPGVPDAMYRSAGEGREISVV